MIDTLVEVPCTEKGCTRVIPTTAGNDLRKIKCPTHSERMRTCKCHSCQELRAHPH